MFLYVVRIGFSRSICFDKISLKLINLIEYMIARTTFIIDIFWHSNKLYYKHMNCFLSTVVMLFKAYRVEYKIETAQMYLNIVAMTLL